MFRIVAVAALPLALGAWTKSDETSRVDSGRRVAVEKTQTEERDGWRSYTPFIQFECRNGASYAFLHFGRVMSCRGQIVAYRAGTKPLRRAWMANTTDCQGFGAAGAAAIGLARYIGDSFVLHVRVTPHDRGPLEYTFDVSGLADAVGAVAEACRWPGKW